jgi:hypothetical protein
MMVEMADEPVEPQQTAQEPPWAGYDVSWQWNPLLWQPRYEVNWWWGPPPLWPWEPQ